MTLRVGPVGFRIGSDWRAPIAAVAGLYQDYPCAEFADYTVRLEAEHVWRRWIRPSIRISGDYRLPEAAPLPLWQGLLAAELGMNLQMALGHRRHLLLHAAVVERDGRFEATRECGAVLRLGRPAPRGAERTLSPQADADDGNHDKEDQNSHHGLSDGDLHDANHDGAAPTHRAKPSAGLKL